MWRVVVLCVIFVCLCFRATISVRTIFLSILQEKTYFFYFIHPLSQNTHISLSILHIYSIKYSFFLHFLLFHSLSSLELSHKPNTNPKSPTPSHHLLRRATNPTQIQNHPHLATINDKIEQTRRNNRRSLLRHSLQHHISGCKTHHQPNQYPSKPIDQYPSIPTIPPINTQLLLLPPNPHIMSLRAQPRHRFWV